MAAISNAVTANNLKQRVRTGELTLLLGTDAASEGLNLQRLGTLINIDLPWNPTRLEQRKGPIQRIGQIRSEVWGANLRYRDSVEDRVHRVLAQRLEAIHRIFGQIPDTLEDVWVKIAQNDEEGARAEAFAEVTPAYASFEEALRYFGEICHIADWSLHYPSLQQMLFNNMP